MLKVKNKITELDRRAIKCTIDDLRQRELKILKNLYPITPRTVVSRLIYVVWIPIKYVKCNLPSEEKESLRWFVYVGQERNLESVLRRIAEHKERWKTFLLPGFEEKLDWSIVKETTAKDYEACSQEDELEASLQLVERLLIHFIENGEVSFLTGPYEPGGCKLFNYPDSGKLPKYLEIFMTYRHALIKE